MITKNNKWMLVLIAIFAALPPFATDTYTPALTNIAVAFHVKPEMVMSTFTTYFMGFALGIVLWGPLSDVFGRKKILIVGTCLYILSSILCPLSASFFQLELFRMGQGFGDAACVTVALAIARDCFNGKGFLKAMTTIGMIMMIAPIVAPIIGIALLHLTGEWQSIFHFLTFYGCILLICCFIIPETLEDNLKVGKLNTAFSYYLIHIVNYKFLRFMLVSALLFAAIFSFIGSSAIIYMSIYHASKFEYAILFGANGLTILLANFVLKILNERHETFKIAKVSLYAALLCSFAGYILISIFPNLVLFFLVVMCASTFCLAICSSSTTAEAFNQVKESFGAAGSINNFFKFTFAGLANLVMVMFSYETLNHSLVIQQLVILLVCVLITHIKFRAGSAKI